MPLNRRAHTPTRPWSRFVSNLARLMAISGKRPDPSTLSRARAPFPMAPVTSLLVVTLGFVGHSVAILGNRLQLPNHICAPEVTRYLGFFTWLTAQTNCICCAYYAVAVVSHVVDSASASAVVVQCFPLAYCLGFMLSILYYGLDYFNVDNIKSAPAAS